METIAAMGLVHEDCGHSSSLITHEMTIPDVCSNRERWKRVWLHQMPRRALPDDAREHQQVERVASGRNFSLDFSVPHGSAVANP